MPRVFRGSPKGSVRRPTEWQGATTAIPATITAGTQVGAWIMLPSTVAVRYTRPTVVRLRGWLDISAPETSSSHHAFGILTWQGEGADVLPTLGELPNPMTDPSFDWLWYGFVGFDGGGAGYSGGSQTRHFEIDSSGMRKFRTGEGLLAVLSSITVAGEYAFAIRALVKE